MRVHRRRRATRYAAAIPMRPSGSGPIPGQAPRPIEKEVIEMNRVLHRLLPVALMAIPAAAWAADKALAAACCCCPLCCP